VLIDACIGVEVEQGLRRVEKVIEHDPPAPRLKVQGGLPQLPGTSIDMPDWSKKGGQE
jgi:hypothetical protein